MAKVAEINAVINGLRKRQKTGDTHCWIDPIGALSVGTYPAERAVFDFASEDFIIQSSGNERSGGTKNPFLQPEDVDISDEAGRRTKTLIIHTPTKRITVGSVKQALEVTLDEIEQNWPGSLKKLCKLSRDRGRSKRMVSDSKDGLYDTEGLERFSSEVGNGYFAATNNSEGEVQRFLKSARRELGLKKKELSITTKNGEDWFEAKLYKS